jgi:hypothetical protein
MANKIRAKSVTDSGRVLYDVKSILTSDNGKRHLESLKTGLADGAGALILELTQALKMSHAQHEAFVKEADMSNDPHHKRILASSRAAIAKAEAF